MGLTATAYDSELLVICQLSQSPVWHHHGLLMQLCPATAETLPLTELGHMTIHAMMPAASLTVNQVDKKINFCFNTSTRQVLYKLHLLPIEKQIDFKCLNCVAPLYLSDVVNRCVPQCNLRSANSYRLLDVAYNLRNYGLRSFSVASPQHVDQRLICLWIQSSSDLLSSNANSTLNMFLGQLFNRLVLIFRLLWLLDCKLSSFYI